MTPVLPQGDGAGVLEILGNLFVEIGFQSTRREVEGLGETVGIVDQASALDLAAQGSFADRLKTFREQGLRGQAFSSAKLASEGLF
ncbi:hypothetical protein BVG79_p2000007 (plasmid) [Ketogulonicigenium robustum]|uniref:Uncharacterized protein n=1 Tax=Ketogulonicigenium robustum TaxID=92947 RepID=A0A1W6P3H9_9RHOB|nr:hypothetical protein BVG79_p2000007 [Ketogulonicigenium robustum]